MDNTLDAFKPILNNTITHAKEIIKDLEKKIDNYGTKEDH